MNGIRCKGSFALGTACGKCEKCLVDPNNPKNGGNGSTLQDTLTLQADKQKVPSPKVAPLYPETDMVLSLRNLANKIESGELDEGDNLTIVYGTRVYHLGTIKNEEVFKQATFNLNVGLHKLMELHSTW